MTGAEPDLRALHVLVVEDANEEREQLVDLLKRVGCRVDVAVDGGQAVLRTAALRPRVVLMDLGLPKIDGWEAIRLIRHSMGKEPYIIALSAFEDGRCRQLAFEAGCDEYVVKSLDVLGALRAFVARRKSP